VYVVVRMGVDLNFVFFSMDSQLIFRWPRFHIDRGCGTLVLDCWNKDFWIYPDDIDWELMILSMLDTRYRVDWDVMLIDNIILFSYDLNYGWISLIVRIFHSLIVNSVFVVDLRIYSVFHDSFLTTSVIRLQRLIYCECDFIDIGDIYLFRVWRRLLIDLTYWWYKRL